MDFINLWPYDVVDLIFQHISGREALNFMQVSKSWNEHLSRSSALKKIVVYVSNFEFDQFIEYLLNSKRKYRHIKVLNGTGMSNEIVQIIANPYHEFNSIVIFRTMFIEKKAIEQIFLNSYRTLERLDLHYVEYENPIDEMMEDDFTEMYVFSRLKNLTIEYNQETNPWMNKYIENFPSLESITLGNGCDEHFKNLILKSPNLTKLTLSGKFFDKNFFKDMSEKFPSQLEYFVFNDILSSSSEDENLSYFNAFFTSQSRTLKRFETDALLEIDEVKNAFKMPNLKKLVVKGLHYNVEFMDFILADMRSNEIPAASLTCFSVHFMNQHLIELLALNARNLIKLKIAQFHPSDVSNPTWFPKLEVLKLFFIDGDLRRRLKEKPEEKRSHFEKMIVKAMTNISSPLIIF